MRVEWDFLVCIMSKMGFPSRWIDRVMACVTYSFFVNGVLYDIVFPSRGLRQGDPISSYLFLLCAEGLGSLIKKPLRKKLKARVSILAESFPKEFRRKCTAKMARFSFPSFFFTMGLKAVF